MWLILLRFIYLVMMIITGVCVWKSAEFFNALPENNAYKSVLAFDVLLLSLLAVAFFIKILVV